MMRLLNQRYLAVRPLDDQRARLPEPSAGRSYMLYAHVPFCERLCPYCSFNRFPFEESRARAYFRALRQEMRMLARQGYDARSMYIGGGTPTVLIDELSLLIDEARQLFDISDVSCETNPNHLTPEILERLSGRVQRLSVGVQSFDDRLLGQMERLEKYGAGMEILQRLQATAGLFDTLNADMIFNFPSQTEDMLIKDLACILESGVTQATFYPLMASSAVAHSLARTVGRVDYQREQRYYEIICEALTTSPGKAPGRPLAGAGAEASKDTATGKAFTYGSAWTFNAASSAMIDEYIVDYEEYPAIGSGGFSYLDGTLYVNTFSVDEYMRRIDAGRPSVYGAVRFSRYDRMRYRLMMQLFGLRLDKKRWMSDFGCSVAAGVPLEYAFYKALGVFASDDQDELSLSPLGRYMLVALMRQFFIGVNGVRDLARRNLPPAERLLFGHGA